MSSVPAVFIVQSYSAGRRGMQAESPIQCISEAQARRVAQRLAVRKAMVLAIKQERDMDSGEYLDPKLIEAHGDDLPDEIADMQRVA